MTILRKLLKGLIGLELLAALLLCCARLNSTLPSPPRVELYTDAVTGRELLALPDRFLLDSDAKWRTLADAYLQCGFFSKAEACLHEAARLDPDSADVALARGFCLERLGMLDEARVEFCRQAQQWPGEVSESAWYRLGRICLQLEQPEDARQAFENAGPEHLPSLYERAKLLVRNGSPLEAAPLLERLAIGHPDDLRVWQLRARAAAALGQSEAAAEARDRTERARPTLERPAPPELGRVAPDFGLPHEVAIALRQQGAARTLAAARLFELAGDENRVQNRTPNSIQETAAALQLEVGNVKAARTILDRQIERDGFPTARARELHGFVEFLEGHPQLAWHDWDRAERLRPETIDHDKLAEIAQQSGDALAARRHKALARQYAGFDAYRNNHLAEALTELREAVAIEPELPDAWFSLGQTERLQGNRAEAETAYRRCLRWNPCHGRARVQLERLAISSRGFE